MKTLQDVKIIYRMEQCDLDIERGKDFEEYLAAYFVECYDRDHNFLGFERGSNLKNYYVKQPRK